MELENLTEYKEWIKELKERLLKAQVKASVAVNKELHNFYWELGAGIVEKQEGALWGSSFLNKLSKDLTEAFPNMKGFSVRNLKYIRQWYKFWLLASIGQRSIAQIKDTLFSIPWGQNIEIISKVKNHEEAFFYVQGALEYNWSRPVLVHQIESKLYERKGKAINNFQNLLPTIHSDLARDITKDPYNFDFLTLTSNYNERELESGLVNHITKFLLELGQGFAYMGKQVKVTVGNRDFYLDLLFYHVRLKSYVVIELKITDFEPEHAGKLNFYIKAVDEQLRKEGDNPTIGLLICKSKDRMVAEYALSDINKPIGISEYILEKLLPENLKSSLPSIEELEAELMELED